MVKRFLKNLSQIFRSFSPYEYAFVVVLCLALFLNINISRAYRVRYVRTLILWSYTYFLMMVPFSFSKKLLRLVAFLIFLVLCFYDGYAFLVTSMGGQNSLSMHLNELTLAVILDTNYREASELLSQEIIMTLVRFVFQCCLVPLLVILFFPIKYTWGKKNFANLISLFKALYLKIKEFCCKFVCWY